MDIAQQTFGKTVKKLRQGKGISLRDFARLIKKIDGLAISPSYLCDIEQERRKPPEHFVVSQMASALNVSEDYLLGLAETTTPEIHELIRDEPEVGRLLRKAKEAGFNNWKAVEKLINDHTEGRS